MCQGHTVPDSMPDSWDAVVTSVAYHVMTASSRVQMYLAIQLTASKHDAKSQCTHPVRRGVVLPWPGACSRIGLGCWLLGKAGWSCWSAWSLVPAPVDRVVWCVVKSAPTRPHKKAMIRSVSDRVIVRTFFHHDLGSWDLMENQKLTLLVTFGRCYTRK